MSIKQSECICSLTYPARNAHSPYCHLWPAPLCNIFSTLSHKRHDFFFKVYWSQHVCFDFLYKCDWNIFHSKM